MLFINTLIKEISKSERQAVISEISSLKDSKATKYKYHFVVGNQHESMIMDFEIVHNEDDCTYNAEVYFERRRSNEIKPHETYNIEFKNDDYNESHGFKIKRLLKKLKNISAKILKK